MPQNVNRSDVNWTAVEKNFRDLGDRFRKLEGMTTQAEVPAQLRDSIHDCDRLVSDIGQTLGIEYKGGITKAA